ncbi:MAG: 50S ribosome-binding GTPase [Planctomycetaceae bacterium]|jgi:predicted  nucleic acid-binding Zn-ribbon protein/GTPase SAR1 family protein|nr:50S ribosome-binding GTPase [Planctomycetaceae bacterium]
MSESLQLTHWHCQETISDHLRRWSSSAPRWGVADTCCELVERFLIRTNSFEHRSGVPLIVAMLGGTGTGKSSLINALLGERVVVEGKERPTTTEAILIVHSSIDPASWNKNGNSNFDLSGIKIEKRNNPILERLAIIDCPDPDTTENAELRESNLARLRAILPICDLLIVTATQQKYRSHRVLDELFVAASGARLIFVQTHADTDRDIRDDWRNVLEGDYETGKIFLIDSSSVVKLRHSNGRLPSEFEEFRQLLTVGLNEEAALRIRRANYFSLAETAVSDCCGQVSNQWDSVARLRERISEERHRLGERMAERMRDDLIRDRRVWESRLVGRVTSQWGYSPFSLVLRIYQGLGWLFSGALLFRARSPIQLAIWGTYTGLQSIKKWSKRRRSKKTANNVVLNQGDEHRLKEAALILTGFANDAGMPTEHCEPNYILNESRNASDAYMVNISQELEGICDRLAKKNNRWWCRLFYEIMLVGMILFILLRPAKNFFYDTLVEPQVTMLGMDFYLVSCFWMVVWCSILLGLFMFRTRSGLEKEIKESSNNWQRLNALELFFAAIENDTNQVLTYRNELDKINQRINTINQQADKLDKRIGRKIHIP